MAKTPNQDHLKSKLLILTVLLVGSFAGAFTGSWGLSEAAFDQHGTGENVAGEGFYEAPNGKHNVSANASKTEPAKLLVIFVCDHATPVTVPLQGRRICLS